MIFCKKTPDFLVSC